MRRFSIVGLASFIVLALAVAACSGGSAASQPATSAATPAAPSAAASEASSPAPSDAPASQPAQSASGACTTAPSGAVAVTIQNFAFSPTPVTAKVGQAIGWTNQDSATHTATLDDGSCTTDRLAQGAMGALVFSKPGTYPYHCMIHPFMKATITVTQ